MAKLRDRYKGVYLRALKEKFEHHASLVSFLMFDSEISEEPDDEETERLLKSMCCDLKNLAEQLPKLF